jgi:hypothetical protein
MRTYLYIIAGITSALLGWNLGQFLLTDLGFLSNFPEIVLFPCVAIALASGMVLNEIFISSPTRPKLCLRKAIIPILIALGLGILSGLIGGLISQIVLLPFISVPSWIVRTLSWLLIGISVGLAEGLTWRWKSIEAGNRQIFYKRFRASIIGGSIASLIAALIFELIRQIPDLPAGFRLLEDPLGFSILGMLLGLTFSITGSPSYLVALRAGAGFEYMGNDHLHFSVVPLEEENQQLRGEESDPDLAAALFQQTPKQKTLYQKASKPKIQNSSLKFIPASEDEEGQIIEEGLSIQLPAKAKLTIGSSKESDIYIPDIFPYVADLILENRQAKLKPKMQALEGITVNGNKVYSAKEILLKHNYLITFISVNEEGLNEDKFYRFVYYNRFLDPQA